MKLGKFELNHLWKRWEYGILEGLIIGVLIAILAFPSILWVILALLSFNTITSLFLLRRNFNVFSKPSNPDRKEWERQHPACPECGSRTRHKNSCSKAKT